MRDLATDAPSFPVDTGFGWGGGLYSLGATVTLEDVALVGNRADALTASAGGAIANEFGGTLNLIRTRYVQNSSFGTAIAVGGAITSDSGPTPDGGATQPPTLRSQDSSFSDNIAQSVVGFTMLPGIFPFSGFAMGGAITNFHGTLEVESTQFLRNVVIGGTGTDLLDGSLQASGGAAIGGAIVSTNFSPFGNSAASLTLLGNSFVGNLALGGSGAEDGGNGGEAAGAAVGMCLGGEAVLESNSFSGNFAAGGMGGGTTGNGGLATGGAVAALSGVIATLEFNTFFGNHVQGGIGSPMGSGGTGQGGGQGIGVLTSPGLNKLSGFEMLLRVVTVSRGTFINNQAHGGLGLTGGNGLGGGVSISAGSQASFTRSTIVNNQAVGGLGATPGVGQGGGVHNHPDGMLSLDTLTLLFIRSNSASDDEDDLFGPYDLL